MLSFVEYVELSKSPASSRCNAGLQYLVTLTKCRITNLQYREKYHGSHTCFVFCQILDEGEFAQNFCSFGRFCEFWRLPQILGSKIEFLLDHRDIRSLSVLDVNGKSSTTEFVPSGHKTSYSVRTSLRLYI